MRIAGRVEGEGEFANQLLGFPGAHIKGTLLDKGEGHPPELIQYINPPSGTGRIARNDLGASHLAFFVEDIEKFMLKPKGGVYGSTIRRPRWPTTMATCSAKPSMPRIPTETGWSLWRSSNASDDR